MNTLSNHPSIVHQISVTCLRFAIGFGLGALAVLLSATAGCGTARGIAHDVSVITAAMAEDPHVEQPNPYHPGQ